MLLYIEYKYFNTNSTLDRIDERMMRGYERICYVQDTHDEN